MTSADDNGERFSAEERVRLRKLLDDREHINKLIDDDRFRERVKRVLKIWGATAAGIITVVMALKTLWSDLVMGWLK